MLHINYEMNSEFRNVEKLVKVSVRIKEMCIQYLSNLFDTGTVGSFINHLIEVVFS